VPGHGLGTKFLAHLERTQVLEWSVAHDCWEALPAAGHITDPVLAVPLPLAPLITVARADDAVARALVAQGNPVLTSYRAEGEAKGLVEGEAKGKAAALLVVLAARGVAIDAASRCRVLAERDPARLARWLARATRCQTIAAVLTDR